MRATHHFIAVSSLLRLNKKEKKFREMHWKYFWSFWFFKKKSKLKEKKKTKTRKLFTGECSQEAKEEQRNLFVFSHKLQLTKLRKKNRKEARKYFWVF